MSHYKSKISLELIKKNIELVGIKGTIIRFWDMLSKQITEDELVYKSTKKLLPYMLNIDLYDQETGMLQKNSVLNDDIADGKTIWVCWFQGMEHAPDLVKQCYERLGKYNKNRIILITDSNISDYINFPKHVMDKYVRGIIKRGHFSDIIRTALLYYYGGVWIDSTMYTTATIPDFVWDQESFVFKYHNTAIYQLASSQFLRAEKGNVVLQRTLSALYAFWEKNNKLVSYYMWHYVFSRAVRMDASSLNRFEQIPTRYAEDNHILQERLFEPFNAKDWSWLKSVTFVHKLSYKHLDFPERENTYYAKLIK